MSQFSFVPRHCTCTSKDFGDFNLLAVHQKKLEESQMYEPPETFAAVMSKIGCRRMCCRRFLLNQIKLFLTSNSDIRIYTEGTNINSFWKIEKKAGSSKDAIYSMGGPPITPKHPFP